MATAVVEFEDLSRDRGATQLHDVTTTFTQNLWGLDEQPAPQLGFCVATNFVRPDVRATKRPSADAPARPETRRITVDAATLGALHVYFATALSDTTKRSPG